MKGLKWYAAGMLAAMAAVGAYAALAAGPAPVIPEEPVEAWEPETVFIAMAAMESDARAEAYTSSVSHAADSFPSRGSLGERALVPQEWTEDDVELLARLLWSSPLRNEDAKRQLVWCVLNRVDDERSMFPATIKENVTRREFTFYDRKAYLSETNLRIAREELQRWTRVLSGIEERPVPEGYVYLRFAGDNNRMIYLSKEIGGEAL